MSIPNYERTPLNLDKYKYEREFYYAEATKAKFVLRYGETADEGERDKFFMWGPRGTDFTNGHLPARLDDEVRERLSLYREQELIKKLAQMPDAWVCIFEGESDHHAALDKCPGIICTTSYSSNVWKPEWSKLLRGRKVASFADNDKQGRHYENLIGRSAKREVEVFKAVHLPGLKEGQDARDWFTIYGGNFEKLIELAERAKVWGPTLYPKAPYEWARLFIEIGHTVDGHRTLHRYRGAFWQWAGTVYHEQDEGEVIRAEAWRFLDEATKPNRDGDLIPFQPSKHDVDQLIDALKSLCLLPEKQEAPIWIDKAQSTDPRDFLPVANGLLYLPSDELRPHTPDFFNLAASTVAYDPSAPAPARWSKFLDQVWPKDRQSKDALHEIFGYALTADTSLQKLFLWFGEPRSGKGTTLRVLTLLIGRGSVVATSMGDLKAQFGLQPLIGKSLATLPDARLGSGDPATLTERLLSISGGDSQGIQRKYKGNWDGCLSVRFLMLTNELPSFADPTGTIGTRFIVLEFANSFLGREDPRLINKFMPELPGILNLAVAGYKRLRKRGHFIQPKSAQGAADELKQTDVRSFIQEKCALGPNEKAPTDKVYAAYRAWCEANGHRPKDSRQFGRLLKSAAKPQRITKHEEHVEGEARRRYTYHGISVEMDGWIYDAPIERGERSR